MRRRYRFWLGWAGGGLLLLASPGLAQIAAPAPLMSPKLEREYAKLQAEVGRASHRMDGSHVLKTFRRTGQSRADTSDMGIEKMDRPTTQAGRV